MKTVAGAPLALRVARRMSRARIRGAGVLTRALSRLGVLDVIAQYDLGRVKFGVPLNRIPWDFADVTNYETELINTFCRVFAPLKNATLLDCGADIGTFCSMVCSRTDNIARIVAVEPNVGTHEFLRANLANVTVPFEIISKAIGCVAGRGRLESPQDNATDHARFLVTGEGPLEITTIDSMKLPGGDIAIKMDIEGGELEAFKGAAETIEAARHCVVTVEAHPLVARRVGRDPVEVLRFLESLRPFHFLVAETGEQPSTTKPIFKEGQTEIWNVVGWTHDEISL